MQQLLVLIVGLASALGFVALGLGGMVLPSHRQALRACRPLRRR
jgi:hypothetical protein